MSYVYIMNIYTCVYIYIYIYVNIPDDRTAAGIDDVREVAEGGLVVGLRFICLGLRV